jgi:glycosyltransferase involved in cell wall biosynthesis
MEKEQILNNISCKKIIISQDIVLADNNLINSKTIKKTNYLKLCFLGRISRMKNIEFSIVAISLLIKTCPNISFDIYGPIVEPDYYKMLNSLIEKYGLEKNISFQGELLPQNVYKVLNEYDFLILPSKGENFGHVIYESIAAGTPVLISNNTFWNQYENNEQWCFYFDLENISNICRSITMCYEMRNSEYIKLSYNCILLAKQITNLNTSKNNLLKVFQ